MAACDDVVLPLLNLSGLNWEKPGTDEWVAARTQVIQALKTYGSFEAEFDEVDQELKETIFGPVVKQLFDLPLNTRERNTSPIPGHAYVGQFPGFPYESLAVTHASSLDGVQRFCNLLWPDGGNPELCKIVLRYGQLMSRLQRIVRRMILEHLGMEKYWDSEHLDSAMDFLRVSEYGPLEGDEIHLALIEHKDPHWMAIVCQRDGNGFLEVLDRQSKWVPVEPTPRSFTVILGEAFETWSNGRLRAPIHRVMKTSNQTRYSVLFGMVPKDGYVVRAPEELVDEDHPLLFKPYYYSEYMKFRFSPQGRLTDDPLAAFCGIKA